MPHIAIIGAGIGALAAAVHLRAAGLDVTLFEKNETPGGKVARLLHDGHAFDLGPTVLTMPFVLRDLFAAGGADFDERVELLPVEPTCRYHWSDGTTFDAFSDPERRAVELRRVFPEDADAVERLLADAADLYDATKDVFLFKRFRGVREMFSPANARLLPKLASLGFTSTLAASLERRLSSPRLVQLFSRFATYNGSSPYLAPATLNVIAHVELGLGTWYPRGGMARIAEELTRLCREIGVEIVCSAPVEGLLRRGSRIVELAAGERSHRVDAVISNVDALWTYRTLLEPVGLPTPRRLREGMRSCSGLLMLATVAGNAAASHGMAHHNIFFADRYREEFGDLFERRRLPEEMTIYASIGSRSDPGLAREGSEGWYLLVNAPASGAGHGDQEATERYAGRVWERLERFGLRPEVTWRRTLGPAWIEHRYNSLDGAIYGSASNSLFSAFLRPSSRVAGLANMYLAGGSAHPGGGVPLVALSGRLAAEAVLEDLAR